MTEGRFETIHNLRPENWDNRRHWTNWHHLYDCEADHLARESCPFHDLRAGGQFQYENWGGGPYVQPIEPEGLNDRKDGDRMDFALGNGTNMGGWGNIPLDTEPGRPTQLSRLPRSTGMHTKKNPLRRGLFGEYPYMPEGEVTATDGSSRRADASGQANMRAGGMKAGGPRHYIGRQPEYIPDPYRDTIYRGRLGHFKTGPVRHDDPKWMPNGPNPTARKKSHGPFLAGKPSGFTIGGDPEWIPDPYDKGRIKNDRRPFRTWHTRTKQSMPTYAPWSTGLATSEARKGPGLDLTENNLPGLNTYRMVNMTQTIGSEAALGSIKRPDPVQLKR